MNKFAAVKEDVFNQFQSILDIISSLEKLIDDTPTAFTGTRHVELPMDEPKTSYERNIHVVRAYQRKNPWILKYESAPRYTTPSKGQLRIHK